ISRTTVALHMKQLNIQSKVRRRFKTTTDSDHKDPVCDNLLNREFKPIGPSLKWVSDITYIHTLEGFLYLTTVIDLFDRKVVGWSISERMSTDETVIAALNMAIKKRKPGGNIIFHSDRGVQYASFKTRNVISSHNMIQSMSRKGNCWDNAVAESFFKTLKTELIYGYKQISKEQMKLKLFKYIEIWYNRKRRHSFLGNLNIKEFWEQYNLKNIKYLNVA
ncbi:MAG: IS3 family transposase, partial [Tannerellaceae bacterium]